MPVTNPEHRAIARAHLMDVKVCRECSATNPITAKKCRKCRSKNLRMRRSDKK
ncbi:MAG: 50S ribosomal protein L40e [Candidatus Heimdallarchaeum aukensis]|uniref:50S ribosomal protein L40e n=2 Tax=Candidatus Heimdallarchaeum TaxID=3053649 RepID=A0A9Y1FNR4_9ARCH|nr:MAG: 50S ribosomal protein L40e [Candidatus Heimdallarchaeum aukensis]UJG42928.1 MAG: 50S ribosomal protein L40e [Candidatus Heimdallarchaeum endolithica]